MQYHSMEHSERYNEFVRIFNIAKGRSAHLQIWAFSSTDNLKPYLSNIAGLDVKELLENRHLIFNDIHLYVDSKESRKKSGFNEGNIFLPLTSVTEAYSKITQNPNANTFYIPHSKDELNSYLTHFPKSKPMP